MRNLNVISANFVYANFLHAVVAVLVTLTPLASVEAGTLSRARGEAAALHRTAKVLAERVCYLDTTRQSSQLAEQLLQTTCSVKELVYDDAPWQVVLSGVSEIGFLNDALISQILQNPTLANDRRVTREIAIFQDRFVNLRKDLDRALERVVRARPPVPTCVTPVPNIGHWPPAAYRQTTARTIPSNQYEGFRNSFAPNSYFPPQNQPFHQGHQPTAPFNGGFNQLERGLDQRQIPPTINVPSFGPQIQVRNAGAPDLKSELVRMLITRIVN